MKKYLEKRAALKKLHLALEKYSLMIDGIYIDKKFYCPSVTAARKVKVLIEVWKRK